MGNISSYLLNSFFGYNNSKLVYCDCVARPIDRHIATYRCGIYCDEALKNGITTNEIFRTWPRFRRYWKCTIRECPGSLYCGFVACDKCLNLADKKYFTYYPDGWTENPILRYWYENSHIDLKLLLSKN